MEPAQELDLLVRQVIGAAIEVHRELGPGFLESVYEEALCMELAARRYAVDRQAPVNVIYKGNTVGHARMDLLVNDQLLVELKTVDALLPIHKAQVISCLRAIGQPLGLLINFNVPILKQGIRRIVLTQ